MRWLWRIGAGVVLAVLLIVGLQRWIDYSEQRDAPVPASTGRLLEPKPDLAADGRGVLPGFRGVTESFYVVGDQDALPSDCTPVLVIVSGGTITISVHPPEVDAPGPIVWPKLGIVLPAPAVVDLTPLERSSLLAIWSALAPSSGVRVSMIASSDGVFRTGERELLLRWIR